MTTTTASEPNTRRAGRAGALAITLVLTAAAPDAYALDFRLRWRPSPGTAITGYRLHVRQQGTDYGTPVLAGLPPVASDGTMSATMTGLRVGPRYYFAVSAVVANGQGSGLSNEVGTCTTDFQCDDNDSCTADTCTAGACRNTAVPDGTTCLDDNLCNGEETCQRGRCTRGPSLSCGDGNACTTDGCNPSSGCTYAPVAGCRSCATASQCDDGNPCTRDTCTPRGTCTNALIGGCAACSSDGQCDDHNACTVDLCTNGRCQSTARTPGESCSDGNPCNGEETCQGGRCRSAGFPCDDSDPCTMDRCSSIEGCTHALSASCESCTAVPRGEFEAKWIAFVTGRGGERLSAMGILEPAGSVDPLRTGVMVEIGDSTGGVVYRAFIPPSGFKLSASRRSFGLNPRGARQLRADGLKRLDLVRMPDGTVRVFLRVKRKQFGAEFPRAYTWTMMLGTQCGVSDCFLHPRQAACE